MEELKEEIFGLMEKFKEEASGATKKSQREARKLTVELKKKLTESQEETIKLQEKVDKNMNELEGKSGLNNQPNEMENKQLVVKNMKKIEDENDTTTRERINKMLKDMGCNLEIKYAYTMKTKMTLSSNEFNRNAVREEHR